MRRGSWPPLAVIFSFRHFYLFHLDKKVHQLPTQGYRKVHNSLLLHFHSRKKCWVRHKLHADVDPFSLATADAAVLHIADDRVDDVFKAWLGDVTCTRRG